MKTVSIIGGGSAALMLAANLDPKKFKVTLYDQKKAPGRKFLVAGEGGLNLTYNSSLEDLIAQYIPSDFMDPIIRLFTNEDLINWLNNHGVSTFVGSSNRVFPDLSLKPIEVLNKLVEHIKSNNVSFEFDKKWLGWNKEGSLTFEGSSDVASDYVVFALGGASWKVTGSDGEWAGSFKSRDVDVKPFKAANCAFGVAWSKNFLNTHKGKPLKNISVTFKKQSSKGELVVSEFGLEGNAIYPLSHEIQESFLKEESVLVKLDLKPTMTLEQIRAKYHSSQLQKVTDILSQDLNLDRTSVGLLKQFSDKNTFLNPTLLTETIKSVPIQLHSADEMDKAISTLGGISVNELDENLQLKKIPNTYVIGEMIDWYAPTGGYLLQGCFSMGFAVAKHLNNIDPTH